MTCLLTTLRFFKVIRPLRKTRSILVFLALLLFHIEAHSNLVDLKTASDGLLNSLSKEMKTKAQYELKNDARATWSNLPIFLSPPAGVTMSELSDEQRVYVYKMLQSSLSSQGYHKASSIIRLDDILYEIESRTIERGVGNVAMAKLFVESRSSGNYAVAFFGSPEDTNWGWKLTGHHLAINVTVSDGRIGVMPGFYGSNPRVVQDGPYSGFSPLSKEHSLGLKFVNELSPEQLEIAVVSEAKPGDVIEGPGQRNSLSKYEGLQSKKLNSEQLVSLQNLVLEFVRNGNADAAGAHLDAIATAGWNNLWFSWRGPIDPKEDFYYRVHGERLLIEYNLQNPNHDHAVVRDPLNDYGENWITHHYKEEHPSQEEVMRKLGLRAARN